MLARSGNAFENARIGRNAMDTEDGNRQQLAWRINSVAVHRKEIKTLRAETIYVPGAGSEFAGATCVGASSAANGNGFAHITCAGLTGLTQTEENVLFVVTPIMIWPRWQSKAPTLASDWSNSRGAQTARRRLARV
jgi:hypothetical protein